MPASIGTKCRSGGIPSLTIVILVALAYSIIHGLLRFVASPTLGTDDFLSLVYAQSWSFGYTRDKPPLYIWMLAAIQTLIGPNLTAVLFLKYALLISTCIFTYLAASRLLHNRSWGALAAFSLSLCFEIGWSMHEGVTYTAALTTMVMGTLWVFLRLCDRGAWPDYLLFGIFCALGLLSNYNFIIFLAILLLSGFSLPSSRRRVQSPRALLSLFATLVLITPFCAWLIVGDRAVDGSPSAASAAATAVTSFPSNGIIKQDHSIGRSGNPSNGEAIDYLDRGPLHSSIGRLTGRFGQLLEKDYLHRALTALLNMLKSPVIFLFPLIPILPLLFPGSTTNFGKAAWTLGLQGLENQHERLLLRMTLWAFAFLAFAVLIGFDRGGSEYMHPLFLPAVLLAVALAKHQHYSACQIYAYEATILVGTLIIIGFRIFALFIGPPICGSCETWARFEPLADALRLAGAENATILTTDRMTAGNLRRLLPLAFVTIADRRSLIPQRQPESHTGPVAVITPTDEADKGRLLALLCRAQNKSTPASPLEQSFIVSADWPSQWKSHRQSVWQITMYKPSEGCIAPTTPKAR